MKNLFVKKNLIDCMCVISNDLRQNNHELPLTCIANASLSRLTCLLHLFRKVLILSTLLIIVGIGNAWGETCTLSNANIVAGSGSTDYAAASATDGCGNSWSAYAIRNKHSNATASYLFWQIKKYGSSTAYYVQIPTMPGNITSITITVSSTQKPMDGGENTATLYFSSSNSTSSTGTGVASGTGASSVTIDCSSLSLKSGYITASGAVRIWDVSVTYTAAPSCTTPPTVGDPNKGSFNLSNFWYSCRF